jgi:hypothetical protein
MKVEVLYFAGCPNHLPALNRVREVLAKEAASAEVTEIEVESAASAERLQFLGSPTIRINGLDIEQAARSSRSIGWMCRTYTHHGEHVAVPPTEWIEAAVREAKHK